MKKYLLSIVIIVFGSLNLFSQQWINYNKNNSGLPNNIVYDIAIDIDNSVWVATDSGIVKFDNKAWTLYTTSNSGLLFNHSMGITIDKKGTKWIFHDDHSFNADLTKFDGINWTIYNELNSPIDWIRKVVVDNDNNKWMCSTQSFI